eukprot:evm.model.NODE_1394_length_20416_cov_25.489517.7
MRRSGGAATVASIVLLVLLCLSSTRAFVPGLHRQSIIARPSSSFKTQPSLQQQQLSLTTISTTQLRAVDDADEVTKKFGLEAGLFSIFKSSANKEAGVDVPSLLAKVGITASSQTETAGTVALAYAAHKAASPIRFPPTVALTPFVANAIGKKPAAEDTEE